MRPASSIGSRSRRFAGLRRTESKELEGSLAELAKREEAFSEEIEAKGGGGVDVEPPKQQPAEAAESPEEQPPSEPSSKSQEPMPGPASGKNSSQSKQARLTLPSNKSSSPERQSG